MPGLLVEFGALRMFLRGHHDFSAGTAGLQVSECIDNIVEGEYALHHTSKVSLRRQPGEKLKVGRPLLGEKEPSFAFAKGE